MLTNGSACISTDRICGATFYQSLRKFDFKCFRSRALLVTSSNNIFLTLWIQRLAMLTNDSACISTIGYVVLHFIRFRVHFDHRICGATIYQSLRALTPVSQSLTVSVSEP